MNDCYAGQSPEERGEDERDIEGSLEDISLRAIAAACTALPVLATMLRTAGLAGASIADQILTDLELVKTGLSTPQKYDDTLVPFVALMRAELHANSNKGDRPGWLAMDTNTALFEIYYHMAKLTYAIRKEDAAGAREFAADVANMCMMLLDTTGLLGVPK